MLVLMEVDEEGGVVGAWGVIGEKKGKEMLLRFENLWCGFWLLG